MGLRGGSQIRRMREGINLKSNQANILEKSLHIALERSWLLDMNFSVVADAISSDVAGE